MPSTAGEAPGASAVVLDDVACAPVKACPLEHPRKLGDGRCAKQAPDAGISNRPALSTPSRRTVAGDSEIAAPVAASERLHYAMKPDVVRGGYERAFRTVRLFRSRWPHVGRNARANRSPCVLDLARRGNLSARLALYHPAQPECQRRAPPATETPSLLTR